MNWLDNLWAWTAEHQIAVASLIAGLIILLVIGLTVVRRRRAALREALEKEAALRRREGLRMYSRDPLGSSADSRLWPSPSASPLRPDPQSSPPYRAAEADADPDVVFALGSLRPAPSTPQGALEIEAGRLAYQIPKLMWRGIQETVEVRLGPQEAQGLMAGFVGRGDVEAEDTPIVETMSVSLASKPYAFDIEPLTQEVQLVKPDLVKGTPFHQTDFARWVWLVTPRQTGEHTLLVKVSAAIRDSRGLPTTSSLPDKVIAVTVRVHLAYAAAGAVRRAVPAIAGTVATTMVGVLTRDYWWPYVRDIVWPAVRAFAGME